MNTISENGFPLLKVERMTCGFGGKRILEEVSCEIGQGEMVSVVGPNGAGKSTFLRALLGMIPVETGSISLCGTPVQKLSRKDIARRMAYVPQVVTQVFPFTVRHFVESARYPHLSPWSGIAPEEEAFCEEILIRTGMAEFSSRTLDTLSGGELQRVWIAGAVAQSAEVMLLDEALSQMDYRFQETTAALLARLNRAEGKTIVQVTHDVNRAAIESRRILAFSAGRLIFDGPPQDFMNVDVLQNVYGVRFTMIEVPSLMFPVVMPMPGGGR